jgi:hypothetical protein
MKVPGSAINAVVDACLGIDRVFVTSEGKKIIVHDAARSAVKYLAPNFTVRAARCFKADKKNTRTTIVLSIGEPNYLETEFIKKCVKAGKPFPVRKIQLKFYPKGKK